MIATAIAHPNIALCKYWGKRDTRLNLPSCPSLSLTVAPYFTRTTVNWGTDADEAWLDGQVLEGKAAQKVFQVLDLIDPWRPRCTVTSENSFPTAAGLASSSSGFAALVLAGSAAAGQKRSLEDLSVLARRGSGSACRSLHGGWVEWKLGTKADGADSHGWPLLPAEEWDVRIVAAIFSAGPKDVPSTEGMIHTQRTSPYYPAWVAAAPGDVEQAREALQRRDIQALGEVMERSTLRMHATMMAADPAVVYWKSGTVWAMDTVRELRRRGIGAWFTMDAGPNVKVLCMGSEVERVRDRLAKVADRVEVLHPGGPARVVFDES